MIQDKPEDIQIQYLFVKSWKWSDALLNEQFQAQPEVGRVYRAMYNTKTKTHRMIILEASKDAIFIPNLINKNEEEGFICECVTLTKKEPLELPIIEEDLDKLIAWTDSKNQDIFNTTPTQDQLKSLVLQSIANGQMQLMHEEAERMAEITEALHDLDNVNSIQLEALLEIIPHLIETSVERHDLSPIELSPKAGLGTNISRALDCLQRYAGDDKRTNEYREDLIAAIGHLMTELERRTMLGIDE